MEALFTSGGNRIHGHTAVPERLRERGTPGLVLCHGFPDTAVGAGGAARSYPDLADRLAGELGWLVLAFAYRGCGASEGDFSVQGWLDDVHAALDHLRGAHHLSGVWLAGFGTGGSLAVCAASQDDDVKGVAALAAPADFGDWAADPGLLHEHARAIGVITSDMDDEAFAAWSAEFAEVSATDAAPEVAPRALLVAHGADDSLVPVIDGRILADAHGEAELRVISGAGHKLRYDPRAIAILEGWLSRQV